MVQILSVDSKKLEKAFLDFPRKLYRNDPNHVLPFDSEIKKAFDRQVNPYFKHGDARRWVAVNDTGEISGRIAAFYDTDKDEADQVKSGGCGFFESIDDQQVAFLLFDAAKKWLLNHGYEAMTGPINFGENDTNWGCLVQGFIPPAIGMTYNLPYYRKLFENYGFKLYYRQLGFHLDLDRPFPERFWKIAEWINHREGYSYRHFDPKQASRFVEDTATIYDQAWSSLREDYTPMDQASLYDEIRKINMIMDPELIWYAYFKEEPIAFFMFLPDANQIFRHLNGRLHMLNKLRFLNYKRKKNHHPGPGYGSRGCSQVSKFRGGVWNFLPAEGSHAPKTPIQTIRTILGGGLQSQDDFTLPGHGGLSHQNPPYLPLHV
jgi:hypothetical protein